MLAQSLGIQLGKVTTALHSNLRLFVFDKPEDIS